MPKLASFLSVVVVLTLVSCGGGGMKTAPVAFTAMNGNFSFTGASQALSPNMIFIGGPLQTDSMGNVSGTLGVSNSVSNCITLGTTAMFNGTINSQNQLMLTSAPINGQVITLNTMVSADGNFFSSNGTYSVAGGCLAGDHGGLQGQHLLTGIYAGSVLIGGNPINVSLNFGAPGAPDAKGAFPLMATATFTGTTACGGFTSLAEQAGTQAGLAVGLTLGAANPTVTIAGTTIDGSAAMLNGTMAIAGGPCNLMSGQITLRKN